MADDTLPTPADVDSPANVMRHAAGRLRAEADAWLPETWPVPFAALLEAVADDDPEDPLHDPACRTCTAALTAARAYLGEA